MSTRDGPFAVVCHIVISDVIKKTVEWDFRETYAHNTMVIEDWMMQTKPNLTIKK